MSDVVPTFRCGNNQFCPSGYFCTWNGHCATCVSFCLSGGPLCDADSGFSMSDYGQPYLIDTSSMSPNKSDMWSPTPSTVFTTLLSTFSSVPRNILPTEEFPVYVFISGYLAGILTIVVLIFVLWCVLSDFKLVRMFRQPKVLHMNDMDVERGPHGPLLQGQKYQTSISRISDDADVITSFEQECSSVTSDDTRKQVDGENIVENRVCYVEENEEAHKQFAENDDTHTTEAISQPPEGIAINLSATGSRAHSSQASLLSNSLHSTDHLPIRGRTGNIPPTRSGEEHEEPPLHCSSKYPISETDSKEFENDSRSMYGLHDQGSIPSQPQKAIPSLGDIMPPGNYSVNNVTQTDDRLQRCPRCNYPLMPNTGVRETGSLPKHIDPAVPSLNRPASNKNISNLEVEAENTHLSTTKEPSYVTDVT